MRTEQEVREALESNVMLYEGFASKETLAARAAHERIRILTWVLEPTEPPPPPSSARGPGIVVVGGNGAAAAE